MVKTNYNWAEGLKTVEQNIDLYKEHEEKEMSINTSEKRKILDIVDKFRHAVHKDTTCRELLGYDDKIIFDRNIEYVILFFLFLQYKYDRINEEQFQMIMHSSENIGHAMLLQHVIAYGQSIDKGGTIFDW